MFVHWQAPGAQPIVTTVSTTGTPTFDSGTKKFGTHSLKLDSTSSSTYDFVNYTESGNYSSYPWTVEFWVNVTINGYPGSNQKIFYSNGVGIYAIPQSSTQYEINHAPYYGGDSSFLLNEGSWHHIAWVKDSSGRYYSFYDGALSRNTAVVPSGVNPTNTFTLGNDIGDTDPFTCYVDELRISKTARYTSNFTPSSSEFTVDSNTLFLAHFNNTYGSDV